MYLTFCLVLIGLVIMKLVKRRTSKTTFCAQKIAGLTVPVFIIRRLRSHSCLFFHPTVLLFLFFYPTYCLCSTSAYFSSLPFVTKIRGHVAGTSVPRPTRYGSCLAFYRDTVIAFSIFLPRRFVSNRAYTRCLALYATVLIFCVRKSPLEEFELTQLILVVTR